MEKMKNKGLFFLLLIIGLVSCGPESHFEEFIEIKDAKWNYRDRASFEFNIDDTLPAYDINIGMRINKDYPYKNIYLLVNQISPKQDTLLRRIEIVFNGEDGRWYGKKTGNLYEYIIPFKKNITVSDTGLYKLEIEQNMREEELSGIYNIGVQVVKKQFSSEK